MAASLNIVVIEDNEDLLKTLVDIIRANNYHVLGVRSAEELSEVGNVLECEVLVVDLNLPGEDGLSLVARLKRLFPRLKILMLTTRSEVKDRVVGYEAGADIYLSKPFYEQELIAALKSISRQIASYENHNSDSSSDVLRLNLKTLQLLGPQCVLSISFNDAVILSALASAPNQTLEYWQLLEALKLDLDQVGRTALAVRITRLRSKISEIGFGSSIKAVRSTGYKLCIPLSLT